MPGQLFVEERVVRGQQIHDAPIGLELIVEKELGLLDESTPQIVVEPRKLPVDVGRQQPDVAGLQPLAKEIAHERRARTRVGEHSSHLPFEDTRIAQFATNRGAKQLVVWNAAPQKK